MKTLKLVSVSIMFAALLLSGTTFAQATDSVAPIDPGANEVISNFNHLSAAQQQELIDFVRSL